MFTVASAVTGFASILAFSLLVGIHMCIASCAVTKKICLITTGIKTDMSFIKKKNKKHDPIVLQGKGKLNVIKVSISTALIDSHISHDEFVSINNVLRKNNEMKKKDPETSVEYTI